MLRPRTHVMAASLLPLLAASSVAARGDEEGHVASGSLPVSEGSTPNASHGPSSYASLSSCSGLMYAHIILMVGAWFFILPIGE